LPDWKEGRLEVLGVDSDGERHLARIHLLTGRTHQIRAQMKALGTPLWGDVLYGAPGPEEEFDLASKLLRFDCPLSQKKMEFHLQEC
jgi:23S rRNA pseudouridine1911/1915/1917 synthase